MTRRARNVLTRILRLVFSETALQLRSVTNPTGGAVLMSYLGWADCRICGARLGTRDFYGNGFVWPERADHYLVAHQVWTPECDEMLAVVRRLRRAT